jgi:hypothetical protein
MSLVIWLLSIRPQTPLKVRDNNPALAIGTGLLLLTIHLHRAYGLHGSNDGAGVAAETRSNAVGKFGSP